MSAKVDGTAGHTGQEVRRLGKALDAAEVDPLSPMYEVKALARQYRAAVRARVIARGHDDDRRIPSRRKLIEDRRVVLARLGDDDPCPPFADEYGTPIKEAQTIRECIDAQAMLEKIEIDMDLSDARLSQEWCNRSVMADLGLAF